MKALLKQNRFLTETGMQKLPYFAQSNFINASSTPTWNEAKRSLLIESFAVNIPIPPIVLYESEWEKYEIIDGKERIATLISFYRNQLKLTGLKYLHEINGLCYKELNPMIKDLIDNRYIRTTMVIINSSANLKLAEELKQLIVNRYQ